MLCNHKTNAYFTDFYPINAIYLLNRKSIHPFGMDAFFVLDAKNHLDFRHLSAFGRLGFGRKLVKSFDQSLSNDLRRAAFQIPALEHLNQFSVLQKADRGR